MFQLQVQRDGVWVPVGRDRTTREEVQTEFSRLLERVSTQYALESGSWKRVRAVQVNHKKGN